MAAKGRKPPRAMPRHITKPGAVLENHENQNSNPARVDDSNVHLLDRGDPARALPRKRKRWAGVLPAHLIIAV